MTTATLVVELLTEELPPKALKALSEVFASALAQGLRARDFLSETSEVTPYATPRRLALSITDVRSVAPDRPFKEKLLPTSVAFDAAGKPTPALLGKLKAKQLSHIDPATLQRESDGKVEALYYSAVAKGGVLLVALQAALDDAIEKLPIPKVMSYPGPGSYYSDQKFVRPAHKLMALHGDSVVQVTALGLEAGNTTSGHRFLSKGELAIANAVAYAPTLEAEGKVIPSFAARRASIVVALEGAAGDATPIMPDALLDEVTALVEWPVVCAGSFDPAFLAVPQECLILTMQLNQRYFALSDDAGKLVNRFLLVSNIQTRDPTAIVSGNERVLRARLADAKFFFDQDRKQTLEARLPKLRNIVYHNKLGSQAERVERVAEIARDFAGLIGADAKEVERAARLAKADLVTDMVGEFPELQGIMGRYYATNDGEPPEVAAAIEQHYWPKAAGGALPESRVAQAVALADKLEVLAGLFSIGQVPTGDKDPYGLRRAALGVVRILIEQKLVVSLNDLLAQAFQVVAPDPQDSAKSYAAALDFIHERLRGYLRDQGYTAHQVAAVLDSRPQSIADLPSRLAAVQMFSGLPEAAALSAANKRIVNILKKSGAEAAPKVHAKYLAAGAEQDLQHMFERLRPQVDGDVRNGDFAGALRALAAAKPVVDRYFDDVMVMADDPDIRANRLALLRDVAHTMNRVADISKLAQ